MKRALTWILGLIIALTAIAIAQDTVIKDRAGVDMSLRVAYGEVSGSITTGGTSQQVVGRNLKRQRITIQNPCSATSQGVTAENLFINLDNAASTSAGNSFELLPCGVYDPWPVPTNAINVNAATTGHQYIAKEAQ